MKSFSGPLSFFTLKPLLLFFILYFSNFWLLSLRFVFNICISLLTVGECSFVPKQRCTYINKPTAYKCCHQEVFRQIDVCSISKKILEKYLWMILFLIEMQFFNMLLYFNRENQISKISSQLSFKLFVKFFDNSYFTELLSKAYLELSWTSTMEFFCKNS